MKHIAPKKSGRHAAPSSSGRHASPDRSRRSAAKKPADNPVVREPSVEEVYDYLPAEPKKRKKKSFIPLIVFAVLFLVIIGGSIFAAYKVSNSPYNLPNVYVGDICVGKLDKEQTRQALKDLGWSERASKPLVVTTVGNQTFEVDPVSSGLTLSVNNAADLAYSFGHDGSMFANLFTYIKNIIDPVEINSLYAQSQADYINSCIDTGISNLNAYMGESEYLVDYENAELRFMKGWNQLKFDKALFASAIVSALEEGKSELSYTTLSTQIVAPDFDSIHTELNKEVVNASYTDDNKFEVIDEVVGCDFDVAQALQLWNEADPGEQVIIPLVVHWPEITGDYLRDQLFRDLLGTVTTKYPNSAAPRRSNLQLATSKISGMVLYPGDEFSFNGVVGVRTEEAGFLGAPAYVDGEVDEEIGGGVCQVSSTLYAATVMAFLETVERECHYFPVNYMQMGSDATVTIPSQGGRSIDFKFRNNKNFPIKIVGICDNDASTITFQIWGTLEDGDYMPVKFDNCYGWQFQDHIWEIDPAYPDREGYTIKIGHETYNGSDDVGLYYRTLTHRFVIDSNGAVVLDEIINMKMKNGNFAMDTYYQH